MNVWVINQFASTPATNSGAGERFYYLAKEWTKKPGWDITIFAGAYNHLFLNPPNRKFPKNTEAISSSLRVVWVWVNRYAPSSGLGRLLNWLSFVAILFLLPKRNFPKPNVIIVSSMSIWPVWNALMLKKRFPKAKFIFEVRDVWPLTPVLLGNFSKSHAVVKMMFWLEKKAFERCDHFVSVLPEANKRAKEVIPNFSKPFTWIPNGISSSLKQKPRQLSKSKHFNVCYTGAVGPANALEFVIEAAVLLIGEGVQFNIFGDGPLRSVYESDERISDIVRFHGKIPKKEIQRKLQEADLLIISWHNIPLYNYGVSANKYNDYMLSGKPILSASDLKSDPVRIANCGIQVPAENPKAIAEGILKFKEMSEDDRQNLGANGLEYLMENQLYPTLAKRYSKLIENL